MIHPPDCACPNCCRDAATYPSIPAIRSFAQNDLGKLMSDAIRGKIEEAIVAAVESAKADVERRVRSSVGQITANVLSRFSAEQHGTELVIRVDIGPQK